MTPAETLFFLTAPFLLGAMGWAFMTVYRTNRKTTTFNKVFSARLDFWLNIVTSSLSFLTVAPLVLKFVFASEEAFLIGTFSYGAALLTSVFAGMRISRSQLALELEEEIDRTRRLQRRVT